MKDDSDSNNQLNNIIGKTKRTICQVSTEKHSGGKIGRHDLPFLANGGSAHGVEEASLSLSGAPPLSQCLKLEREAS